MKIVLPLGGGSVCFIISFIAFSNQQIGIGLLFLLVGVAIVVFGIIFGSKSG